MDVLPLWIFYFAAGAIGLELGGLATIFIQRWIDEVSIFKPGRSRCPSCEERLAWKDTIPILSYFLLKGKCRHCETRIGPQYMMVEVSCLAWSLALAHLHGPSLAWGVYLILGCMLIAGSFIDFETMLLPNRVTLGGAAIAIAACFVLDEPGWRDGLLGAATGGGFFWLLQQGYRLLRREEGLGTGDVKLMVMVGAMTGFTGLPLTILLASATSAVGIFIYLLRPDHDGVKTRIPFGPFLSLGGMLYVLYGQQIMNWWLTR